MHHEDKALALICAVTVIALIAVAVFTTAHWVGRAEADASVECVKAGGDWVDAECRRKP